MWAGKTVFITSFLKARWINKASSPTYTIAHYHQNGKENLVHYDLYRLENDDQNSWIDENFFDDNTTVLVEWSERLNILPVPRIEVKINKLDKNKREIIIDYIWFEIPEKEFNNLIKEYKIPKHVWQHILAVKKVAEDTYDILIEKWAVLNKNLIQQAAMLHDLTRYYDFKTFDRKNFTYKVSDETWNFWLKMRKKYQWIHHSEIVYKILCEKWFHNLWKIVLAHQSMHIFKWFDTLSEKILHYADWKCKHDQIVSIKERIADLKIRYWEMNPDNSYWDKLLKYNLELEKELLNYR